MSLWTSPTSYLLPEAGDPNVVQNFGEAWLEAFRQSPAFAVWDRITDPVVFDIVEARFVQSWLHLDKLTAHRFPTMQASL